jgi:HK97 family phage major capsid protein
MLGILADPAINLVPRTKAGTVQYEDLINLESSLDENFTRLNFVSRRATVNTLRKQKDTIGQPVYHDGFTTFLGGAMVPQLLGYPIIKTRNVPVLGAQGDLILGDFGFYIWALRQDMTIDTSRDALFFFDETCIRFVMREDGAPGVSIAFSVLDEHLS